MNELFTHNEVSLLIRLLIAHIITDFLLQTEKGVIIKKQKLLKSTSFWLHGLYTGIVTVFFMGNKFSWPVVALITCSHLLIDYCKIILNKKIDGAKWKQRELWLFIADQLLHLLIIILAWLLLTEGFEKINIFLKGLFLNYRILLIAFGYLISIGPVTYLIKFLTFRWADDIIEPGNSLKDAGKWIGMLERTLVITLVLIGQFTAIGFLVTAKSILRLIDKPEISPEFKIQKSFSSRKHTEYVLIGTFLSFGSAILIGLFINWFIKI